MTHKDRFLSLFYFSSASKILSNTLNVLSACLLMIQVCIPLCPLQSSQLLNTDLQTISDWAAAWLVKRLSMIFLRKRIPVFHPLLFKNGTMIKITSSHRHLGLTFSNSSTWDEHVKSISEKFWSMLNLLRGLNFRVSRKSLVKME